MRIAIFSDVHGNLSGLQAVLDQIDRQPDLDTIVFAGDLCVFGPRPQECVNLLRQRQIPGIVGNTDEWLRHMPPITDEMDESERNRRLQLQATCRWTARQLDPESISWIDELRQSFRLVFSPTADPADDLLIVHANPVDLSQIIFPSLDRQLELYGRIRQKDEDIIPILDRVEAGTIAFGHLHIPNVRRWRGKLLVNISSVSLPGDGDARAKYTFLTWRDSGGWSFEHVFIPYGIEEEIEAFRQAQPPGWEDRLQKLQSLGYIPQVV